MDIDKNLIQTELQELTGAKVKVKIVKAGPSLSTYETDDHIGVTINRSKIRSQNTLDTKIQNLKETL